MYEKEYKIGNAIVRVIRPELTDRERAKREGIIQNALQQFGKAMHQEAGNPPGV